MQVVGITTQQEYWAASKNKKFKINELLVVEDSFQKDLLGEVVETSSYNRFIPFSVNNALVDNSVLKSLELLGYDISADTINIAKIRLLEEAEYPVETGAKVRNAHAGEVSKYLIPKDFQNGLVVGTIKSTETMYEELDADLKDIVHTCTDGVMQRQKQAPFIFDVRAMCQYPHVGIFGGSGSGKSFAIRVLIEELMKKKIPAVVFDPHYEMDFTFLADKEAKENMFIKQSRTLRIGYNVGVNFSSLKVGELKNLLSASGPISDAMSVSVDVLLKKKDSFNAFNERVNLLCEALEMGKARIQETIARQRNSYEKTRLEEMIDLLNEYSNQVPLLSARGIAWRLKKLQNEGIFNNDILPVEDGIKKNKVMIIQGSTRLMQVFASYLLSNLYQKRRNFKDLTLKRNSSDFFPPFIIVTDEAHTFAPRGFDVPAKHIIKEIAQEGRKYGVFLILASQRPALLDETTTAQLNSKLIFRTIRASDLAIIKEETDITPEEAKRLPYLKSGDAFFSSAIQGRTIPVRIRYADTESPHLKNSFDELSEYSGKGKKEVWQVIISRLPIPETALLTLAEEIFKHTGIKLQQEELQTRLNDYVEEGKLVKKKTPFGEVYDKGQ